MTAAFRVRRVPLNYCDMHRLVGVWAEDGTDRWHCSECIAEGIYMADTVLKLDREIHLANHGERRRAGCPFCNGRTAA